MGNKSADVIVVGLGAHGSASVWQLAKRGVNVIGFDAYTPPHTLGSSHGDTRVIRQIYAEHPDYVPIMLRGYEVWRELEQALADDGDETELLRIVGGLTVGRSDGENIQGVKRSAKEYDLEVEILDAPEIRVSLASVSASGVSDWSVRFPVGCPVSGKMCCGAFGPSSKRRSGPALQRAGQALATRW